MHNFRRRMAVFLIHIMSFVSILREVATQSAPQPDSKIHYINISPDIYRFYIPLKNNTFMDKEDGDINSMRLQWLLPNGSKVSKENWVQLNEDRKELVGFTTKKVYQMCPPNGYRFLLLAIDSDGNSANKTHVFMLTHAPKDIQYSRLLILSSTLPSIVDSNFVEILFYIQERKLFPYSLRYQQGISDVSTFITEDLKITIVNGKATIKLFWSVHAFTNNQCQFEKIVSLRSKTLGGFRTNYTHMFLPEFRFMEETETFEGVCSHISGGKPMINPMVGTTFLVETGKHFSFTIPSDIFLSPLSGRNMELSVALYFYDGQPIANRSWIYLSGTSLKRSVKIEGYISYIKSVKQRNYVFRLNASTPLLEKASRLVYLNASKIVLPEVNFIFVLRSVTSVFKRTTNLIQSMISILAHQLVVSTFQLFLYDVEINNKEINVKWALTSCLTSCNIDELNFFVKKLVLTSSQPVGTLKYKLSTIGFPLSNVTIVLSELYRSPIIRKRVGTLRFSKGSMFHYKIPKDAYIDALDGPMVKLSVIMKNGAFNPSNWIKVEDRMIQGVPIGKKIVQGQAYEFILRIENQFGNFVDDIFFLIFDFDFTKWIHLYKVRCRYDESFTNVASILYAFMTKISKYLNYDNNKLIIHDVNVLVLGRSIEIIYYNTTETISCLRKDEGILNSKLVNGGILNPVFISAMKPEFEILEVQKHRTKNVVNCNSNEPPVILNRWGPITVEITQTYIFQVPEFTFYDKEQGYTRNLSLDIRYLSGKKLKPDFWVAFDVPSQTLAIVASMNSSQCISATSFPCLSATKSLTLQLTAIDNKNQSVSQNLEIVVATSTIGPSHLVVMRFSTNSKNLDGSSFVSIYNQLRSNIRIYFEDNSRKDTVSYYYTSNNLIGTMIVRWFNSTVSKAVCEYEKLIQMQRKLFSTSTEINSLFLKAFSEFHLYEVEFVYRGKCEAYGSHPVVLNEILPIKLSFCRTVVYSVPPNTFHDRIDGNTRNLRLTFTDDRGQYLTRDSFVYFDEERQTIVCTLFAAAFQLQTFPITYKFILKATTKRGLSVRTNVFLYILYKPSNVNLYFKLTGLWHKRNEPLASIARYFTFKTSTFLNYLPGENIYIKEISRQLPSAVSITFSSCLLQYGRCDVTTMENIKKRLYNGDNTAEGYRNYVLPDLSLLTFNIEEERVCDSTNSPPIQLSPIEDLTLRSCSTAKVTLSPTTFRDEEDGYDLNYVIMFINGKFIGQRNWIQADSKNNIFSVTNNAVLRQGINKRYTLIVRAFDRQLKFADAIWNIKLRGSISQEYYKITLELIRKQSLDALLTERYHISNFINRFFKGNITNGISLSLMPNNLLKFVWSSCSLPLYCDNNAATIFFMNIKINNVINRDFLRAFLPRYHLINVSMTTDEKCNGPLSPPVPKKNRWTINVNKCGALSKSVPEDIFIDNEDGNTRNLNLTLEGKDGRDIPRWLILDIKKQIIFAYPTRSEVIAYNNSPFSFMLRATDSTGLSASVEVMFSFTISEEPKYAFKFHYNLHPSTAMNRVQEMIAFSRKLATYVRSSVEDIGVLSYSHISSTFRLFIYADCSVSYDPCNISALASLRKMFIDKRDNIDPEFNSSMSPQFTMRFATSEPKLPCISNNTSSPVVFVDIPTLFISLCQYYEYMIPQNTFQDKQDGSTRNLSLALSLVNGDVIGSDSWVQFDSSKQLMRVMPIVREAINQPMEIQYRLQATNSLQLSASTLVNIVIKHQFQLVNTCPIKTELTTTYLISDAVTRLYFFRDMLQQFFQVKAPNYIAIVDYKKRSTRNIHLSWSYCSLSHKNATSADEYAFVTNILSKLYGTDKKTINNKFHTIFGDNYTVTKVKKSCKNVPPVTRSGEKINVNTTRCQAVFLPLDHKLIVDFEDGNTTQLYLQLVQKDFNPLSPTEWIQFDRSNLVIYGYPNMEILSRLNQSVFQYKLVATDKSNGKKAIDVVINVIGPSLSTDYVIEIGMESNITRPDYLILFDLMRQLGKYFRNDMLNVVRFVRSNTSLNLQWGFCRVPNINCTCRLMKRVSNVIYTTNSLASILGKSYSLNYVRDIRSDACAVDTSPKVTLIPPFDISVGQYSTYKIPSNSFYDKEDGFVKNLTLFIRPMRRDDIVWTQVDQKSKTVCAVIPANMYSNNFTSNEAVLYGSNIAAQDSCGNQVNTNLTFLISPTFSSEELNYIAAITFTVTYKQHNPIECLLLQSLVRKIAAYSNQTNEDIAVQEFSHIKNLKYFSWGFRNYSGSNCSVNDIQRLQAKFIYPNASMNTNFIRYMLPEFNVTSFRDNTSSRCVVLLVPSKTGEFPWWIIWLICGVASLFFLLWLMWILWPRCCPDMCCGSRCCVACCTPSGSYSSLKRRSKKYVQSIIEIKPEYRKNDSLKSRNKYGKEGGIESVSTTEAFAERSADDNSRVQVVPNRTESTYESLSDLEKSRKVENGISNGKTQTLTLPAKPVVNFQMVKMESYRDERDYAYRQPRSISVNSFARNLSTQPYSIASTAQDSDIYAVVHPVVKSTRLKTKYNKNPSIVQPTVHHSRSKNEYRFPMKRRLGRKDKSIIASHVDRHELYRKHVRPQRSLSEINEVSPRERPISAFVLESPIFHRNKKHFSRRSKISVSDDGTVISRRNYRIKKAFHKRRFPSQSKERSEKTTKSVIGETKRKSSFEPEDLRRHNRTTEKNTERDNYVKVKVPKADLKHYWTLDQFKDTRVRVDLDSATDNNGDDMHLNKYKYRKYIEKKERNDKYKHKREPSLGGGIKNDFRKYPIRIRKEKIKKDDVSLVSPASSDSGITDEALFSPELKKRPPRTPFNEFSGFTYIPKRRTRSYSTVELPSVRTIRSSTNDLPSKRKGLPYWPNRRNKFKRAIGNSYELKPRHYKYRYTSEYPV